MNYLEQSNIISLLGTCINNIQWHKGMHNIASQAQGIFSTGMPEGIWQTNNNDTVGAKIVPFMLSRILPTEALYWAEGSTWIYEVF